MLRSMRIFLIMWFGQLLSLVGSGLTGFALGVWVYQRTGSTTQFALISLFTTMPGILLSPLAGALVDRWDRRRALLLSDLGAGLSTLSIAILIMFGRVEIWYIYVAMGVSSAFGAFRWPAYAAATTMLAPKKHLARASGMVEMADAISRLAAPVIAVALTNLIQVHGVILVDVFSFIFAVVTLFMIRIPSPPPSTAGAEGKGTLFQEALYGWRYIRQRPGFLGLMLYFVVSNFLSAMSVVLLTPLVLGFTSSEELSIVMSTAGIGMLAGGLLVSIWGGPKRQVRGVLIFDGIIGICIALTGLRPSVWLVSAAILLRYICLPIVNGCSQAIWQSKIAPDVQGRVFATRRMFVWSSLPLAFLGAGPLADRVFRPLLVENGPLASSLGPVLGVGDGRGIGLLYLLLGVLNVVAASSAFLYPRLRRLDEEVPDAVPETIA